eukprot:scaffold145316_cov20-Tisochrysis_lutea.AAC.1
MKLNYDNMMRITPHQCMALGTEIMPSACLTLGIADGCTAGASIAHASHHASHIQLMPGSDI